MNDWSGETTSINYNSLKGNEYNSEVLICENMNHLQLRERGSFNEHLL